MLGNQGAHVYIGNMNRCEKWQEQYTTAERLRKHKCRFCDLCLKLFSDFQRLKSHRCIQSSLNTFKTQSLEGKKNYVCSKCTKTLTTKGGLQNHFAQMFTLPSIVFFSSVVKETSMYCKEWTEEYTSTMLFL